MSYFTNDDIWKIWGEPVQTGPQQTTQDSGWLDNIFKDIVGLGRDWLGAETQLEIARINRDAQMAADATPGALPGVDPGATYGSGGLNIGMIAIWGGAAVVGVLLLKQFIK
ncbi:MAG: hypothetical protein ACFB0Z_06850 [Candidatus Phaeomarinobacter sp.]